MLAYVTIYPPTEGINTVDEPLFIGDNQARTTKNMYMMNGALRTTHVPVSLVASDYGPNEIKRVDDILLYRPRQGAPAYLFASNGKVYACDVNGQNVYALDYTGDPTARIRLLQFQDKAIILNGVNENKMWDGQRVWNMGIEKPRTRPQTNYPGTDRVYCYTYYNSTWDIESDPSGFVGGANRSQSITVTASTDPQVDKIRIYRTGWGILDPRLALEVPNVSGAYLDNTADEDVATNPRVELDHGKPPILADGIVHNNRLFGWRDEVLYVSNECDPYYMPIVPFIESERPASGGPIEIAPGDGSFITAVAPWGGMLLVFKGTQVYRVLETEIGFYTYQSTSLPACIAPKSVGVMQFGLVYLAPTGWVLVTPHEEVVDIGSRVRETSNNIYDLNSVSAIGYADKYIVCYDIDATTRQTLIFSDGAWYGPVDLIVGHSFAVDSNGILFIGRADKRGLSTFHFKQHDVYFAGDIDFCWRDKAREYEQGRYVRVRRAWVYGASRAVARNLRFDIYDENDTLLASHTFDLETDVAEIGIDNKACGRYLSFEIAGTLTRSLLIYKVVLELEILHRG